ncbi:MAG TPA: cupin domain-containing protein [Pseudonocardia sp.]|jgi:quercetin dioxygenase-like cupin family protein
MKVRRVITGLNNAGRSAFLADELLDAPALPGLGEVLTAWSANQPATYPGDCTDPRAPGFFPPVGGVRVLIASQPPDGSEDTHTEAHHSAEDHGSAVDVADLMEADNPGMHVSDTTDFIVVLSGETTLELDNGAELVLKAGDTLVQNGVRHRWRNHSDKPMVMAIVMVGANRT